jgi:hypothetical protein
METLFVTNNGDFSFEDGFDGKRYQFAIDSTVEIPLLAAKHIFGYGEDNKIPYLIRLGWLQVSNDMDKAMGKLANFQFDTQRPIKGHSKAPVVDKVAPLPLKNGGGAKVQAA